MQNSLIVNTNKIHKVSGIIISIFVFIHLFNHFYSIFGAEKHIEVMQQFRLFYRNIFAETILLIAITIQIISGIKLFKSKVKTTSLFFEKLHIWSGLYLVVFFIIHLSAVFAGRFILHLDTNFYFGVAGLNHFPNNLFFIPYYALAIISFFGHIAAIHNKKMKINIFGIQPNTQSKTILIFGILLAIVIFYGLTNNFEGITIPQEYNVLIGK